MREDNRLEGIRLLNAEDDPASIGLIIDNSGSMRDKHTDVTRAAVGFVRSSNTKDEIFIFPKSLRDMERVWHDIAMRIRSQYTIGYRSSNPNHDGKFRAVKIAAGRGNSRNLTVSTRPGYSGPSDPVVTK